MPFTSYGTAWWYSFWSTLYYRACRYCLAVMCRSGSLIRRRVITLEHYPSAANVRVTFYLDDLPDANQISLHFMIILFKRPANKYCVEQCCSKTWPFLIFSRTKWYRSSIWVGALVTFWLLSQRNLHLKILKVFASNHLSFPLNTWRISHTLLFLNLAFLLAATLDTANVYIDLQPIWILSRNDVTCQIFLQECSIIRIRGLTHDLLVLHLGKSVSCSQFKIIGI